MNLFSRGFKNKPHMKFKSAKEDLEALPVSNITLDPQQLNIVYSNEKNIIVVAGAGSGKTRVLTERIRHLIEDLNVPAHNIVSITFTNMAAEEMKLRLKDVKGIGDCFIGTIHSFANHIMKESGERYTLFSNELDIQLHKELINKYCKNLTIERYLAYKDLESDVDKSKLNEGVLKSFFTPSEISDLLMLYCPCKQVYDDIKNNTHLTFGESLSTLCKKRNIITFDELLVKAKDYFERIQAKIEYVFVDEFQDVGTLEYNFVRALNAENYFFVGDDYQSIYGFKGGNVGIFKNLVKDNEFTDYYLTNNYRNSKAVLNIATTVINQVESKINKDITPISNEEGKVVIKSKGTLTFFLNELNEANTCFKDWFLLTRTNKELYNLANLCDDLDIPYVTFKREGLTLAELNEKKSSRKLKILTVHTAKGLEVDNVILYGNFPVYVPYYRNNDEERKVMYVGITRAKKNIFIFN